jgi:hypothetical protein
VDGWVDYYVGTAVTGNGGDYCFDVPASSTDYRIEIVSATLPGAGASFTNLRDADSTTSSDGIIGTNTNSGTPPNLVVSSNSVNQDFVVQLVAGKAIASLHLCKGTDANSASSNFVVYACEGTLSCFCECSLARVCAVGTTVGTNVQCSRTNANGDATFVINSGVQTNFVVQQKPGTYVSLTALNASTGATSPVAGTASLTAASRAIIDMGDICIDKVAWLFEKKLCVATDVGCDTCDESVLKNAQTFVLGSSLSVYYCFLAHNVSSVTALTLADDTLVGETVTVVSGAGPVLDTSTFNLVNISLPGGAIDSFAVRTVATFQRTVRTQNTATLCEYPATPDAPACYSNSALTKPLVSLSGSLLFCNARVADAIVSLYIEADCDSTYYDDFGVSNTSTVTGYVNTITEG